MKTLEKGTIFAEKYRILRLIGSGGGSHVYKAEQLDFSRLVALKILKNPAAETAEAFPTPAHEGSESATLIAKRFRREATLMAQLRSPYTVTMYDYGQLPGCDVFYMVLEYVNGRDLFELIEQEGPQPPERVVRIARQVLESLKEAHELGILHRDIKPQNIMLYEHRGQSDQIKVLDFGIAKVLEEGIDSGDPNLTEHDALIGTPRYMAPEYIRTGECGPPIDIYSFGLVAYELLVGVSAIGATSSLQVISQQLDVDSFTLPPDLELDPRLRAIVERMIHKDNAIRYQSADQILIDLELLETKETLSWDATAPLDEPSRARPHTRLVLAALLLLVCAVGGYALYTSLRPAGGERPPIASAPIAPPPTRTASAAEPPPTPVVPPPPREETTEEEAPAALQKSPSKPAKRRASKQRASKRRAKPKSTASERPARPEAKETLNPDETFDFTKHIQ